LKINVDLVNHSKLIIKLQAYRMTDNLNWIKYLCDRYQSPRIGQYSTVKGRNFHSYRGVLQATWEELAGKVGHRDQLIICLTTHVWKRSIH